MTSTVDQEVLRRLGPRQRAALIAGALQRMDAMLAELVEDWPGSRVPARDIIEQYGQAARGGAASPVRWDMNASQNGNGPTYLDEMLNAATEFFGTANQSLADLDARSCQLTLAAAEELAEAANTWATSDELHESVGIDSSASQTLQAERGQQFADVQKLTANEGTDLAQALAVVLKDAARSGSLEAARLRKVHRKPTSGGAPAMAVASMKEKLLLDTLSRFTGADWALVESCARRLDRPHALAAARLAMKEIGVHPSHELLRAASMSLGLPEGSLVWEVASRALLGAAAWDKLPDEPRRELVRCFIDDPQVAAIVSGW
jgi:hypothetical protein